MFSCSSLPRSVSTSKKMATGDPAISGLNALRLGELTEDGLSYKEKFVIRFSEVGNDGTATIETIANLLQEVGGNHFKGDGFSTDRYATTITMRKLHLTWVYVRIHIEVHKYPAWSDVVEIESWVQSDGKIGNRRDWIIKDYVSGEVIGRATREVVHLITTQLEISSSSVLQQLCGTRRKTSLTNSATHALSRETMAWNLVLSGIFRYTERETVTAETIVAGNESNQFVNEGIKKIVDSGTKKTYDSDTKKIADLSTSKTADSGANKIVDPSYDLYHVKRTPLSRYLIFGTLGALALASEPPTNHLMHINPVGQRCSFDLYLPVNGLEKYRMKPIRASITNLDFDDELYPRQKWSKEWSKRFRQYVTNLLASQYPHIKVMY
ncbi:oleoyl-acyl carrier protein thioesterase [Artemisia annua]|uniref:Acyl-[acyl-carrier-protein] hydrolase n=1 Tax=Artemisia annua TaxID=35608 RepID=A0A2U1M190_ARTAN|nr:oleoyl-acyl carrier protein thioesterase [Artemisia annua]